MGSREVSELSIPAINAAFEPSSSEKVLNQDLAKRIKNLLTGDNSNSGTKFFTQVPRGAPKSTFRIFPIKEGARDLIELPKDIKRPLYVISLNTRRITNDNGIYRTEVAFLFNQEGQGARRIFIERETFLIGIGEEPTHYTENVVSNFPHLSFPVGFSGKPYYLPIGDARSRIDSLVKIAETKTSS